MSDAKTVIFRNVPVTEYRAVQTQFKSRATREIWRFITQGEHNGECSFPGMWRLSLKQIARETGYGSRKVKACVQELVSCAWLVHDCDYDLFYSPRIVDQWSPHSESNVVGCIKSADRQPYTCLKNAHYAYTAEVLKRTKDESFQTVIKRLESYTQRGEGYTPRGGPITTEDYKSVVVVENRNFLNLPNRNESQQGDPKAAAANMTPSIAPTRKPNEPFTTWESLLAGMVPLLNVEPEPDWPEKAQRWHAMDNLGEPVSVSHVLKACVLANEGATQCWLGYALGSITNMKNEAERKKLKAFNKQREHNERHAIGDGKGPNLSRSELGYVWH